MRSSWTPEGEHRVAPTRHADRRGSGRPRARGRRAARPDPPRIRPLTAPRRSCCRDGASSPPSSASSLAAPAEDVVANHCFGLFQLAALAPRADARRTSNGAASRSTPSARWSRRSATASASTRDAAATASPSSGSPSSRSRTHHPPTMRRQRRRVATRRRATPRRGPPSRTATERRAARRPPGPGTTRGSDGSGRAASGTTSRPRCAREVRREVEPPAAPSIDVAAAVSDRRAVERVR